MDTLLAAAKTAIKLLMGQGVRKSYGQFGEDALVQAMLVQKTGTYVDVGAYHPVLYSNTYSLYRRGWKGLIVDPNEEMRGLYRLFRPRDTFVHAAAGLGTTGTYYRFSDGAYNTMSKTEADERKRLPHLTYIEEQNVQVRSLTQIVNEHSLTEIGFLNIDVEGKDLEVLKSYDWSIEPRVIAVEAAAFNPDAPQTSELYSFLRSKKYLLKGFSGLTLVWLKER